MLQSAILASDHVLSPVTSDQLSAREFMRGMASLLDDLETATQYSSLSPPKLSLMLNRLEHNRSSRDIAKLLRNMYTDPEQRITILSSSLRHLVSFQIAASLGQPIHRYEPRKPADRVAPAGADQIIDVAIELNPEWKPRLEGLRSTLTKQGGRANVSH